MIALTSQTAAAVALQAAEGSWIMFVQMMPPGMAGPIKIEGLRGKHIARRLEALTNDSPYEVQLIGLLESQLPQEDAETIAHEFSAYQIRGWWFDPQPELLLFIQNDAQSALTIMLSEMYSGGLSDHLVDIDEIAKIINVSVPTIRRMISRRQIPAHKFGNAYRFVPNDVIASLRR